MVQIDERRNVLAIPTHVTEGKCSNSPPLSDIKAGWIALVVSISQIFIQSTKMRLIELEDISTKNVRYSTFHKRMGYSFVYMPIVWYRCKNNPMTFHLYGMGACRRLKNTLFVRKIEPLGPENYLAHTFKDNILSKGEIPVLIFTRNEWSHPQPPTHRPRDGEILPRYSDGKCDMKATLAFF